MKLLVALEQLYSHIYESYLFHFVFMLFSWCFFLLCEAVDYLTILLSAVMGSQTVPIGPVKVRKILFRKMLGHFDQAHFTHFLSWTVEFRDLSCLWDDSIALYYITTNRAHFIRLPRAVHTYNCQSSRFQFVDLFSDALEVFVVDTYHLAKYSHNWPQPKSDSLVFMFSTGRSGSTLLARMVENSCDANLVFSEPPVFGNLGWLGKQGYLDRDNNDLVKLAFQFVCKPVNGYRRIVIKFDLFGIDFSDHLYAIHPQATFLYISRNPYAVINSYYKGFFRIEAFFYLKTFIRSLYAFAIFEWLFSLKSDHRHWPPFLQLLPRWTRSEFQGAAALWADMRMLYMSKRKSVKKFIDVNFDNIDLSAVEFAQTLLEACRIDPQLYPKALTVLSEDSQDNTVLSRNNLQCRQPKFNLTATELDSVKRFVDAVDPNFMQSYRFANVPTDFDL